MNRISIISTVFILLVVKQVWAQSLQEGVLAIEYDKFEQAKGIFSQLTQKEPTSGINFYYLGIANLNLYNIAEAKTAFENGIKAEPTLAANYAGMGRLLLDENKTEEARSQFNKALSFSKTKDGRYKDINAVIFVAANMIGSENPLTAEAKVLIDANLENEKLPYEFYITAGDVYLEINDGGKAASFYEKAISIQDGNPKAYVRVSVIWLRVKNAEATKTELDRAIKTNPNYAPALKAQSEYYYQTKQYEKAKDAYRKYLDNSEPSIANKKRFARILYRSKDWGAAAFLINDIHTTDSSDIFLYRLLGYSLYEFGMEAKDKAEATRHFENGLQAMKTFMSRIPSDKVVSNDYEYLGKLYSRLPGNDSLATYNITKALELDPNKIELYKEAGAIYYKLKKFEESVRYFEYYIQRANKVLLVDYQQLGLAAYYSKQYQKCDTAYIRILELKPDYIDGYYWRATANASMDTEQKDTVARHFYERFVAGAEANPEKYKSKLITSYEYLGGYAIQKDDNKTAKLYYEKIIKLDAENKNALGILKQLK